MWFYYWHRLCGYDKNYLSLVKSEKTEGSQKLLHWSCSDVGEWLTSIQLEQYAAALDKTGINGPIMVQQTLNKTWGGMNGTFW